MLTAIAIAAYLILLGTGFLAIWMWVELRGEEE